MPPSASAALARGMIGLLGPVEVRGAAPRGRSLAVLLAVLALESGRAVSMPRIVAELWADEPPASSIATVHAYVSRLRSWLRPHATIEGTPAGYTLHTEDQTDAADFEQLVDSAYRDLAAGRAGAAGEAFDAALALWRGEPFGGVGGAVLAGAAGRLTSLRRDARVGLARAALATGDARRAVGIAEALVSEVPLDESAWEVLILALDAAGRPAAAIEAFAACRERLADELGTEPGPRLRDAHVRLLRGERLTPAPADRADAPEAIEPSRADVRGATRAGSRPAPPIDDPAFPGRIAERRALAALVDDIVAGESPVALIVGEAGIGKTTLLDFAVRTAQAAGCRVVLLRALAGLTTPPFWTWSEALRRLGTHAPTGDAVEATATERFLRIEAIADALEEAIASTPTMLVVDDVQWCDAASLDAMRVVLSRTLAGFGVVLAARDHDATDAAGLRQALAAMRRETALVELRPNPLSVDDVARLAAASSGSGAARAVRAVRADEIVARSGGNPFLVHELLQAPDETLPASAVDAAAARLATLPAATVAALRLAAVAGTTVDVQLVAAAHGVTSAELVELLQPAVESGLLRRDPGGATRFRHDLLREAIAELTPSAARLDAHARLAAALDDVVTADPDRIAELAHHRYAAAGGGASPSAADALQRAADHAASRLGYEQAALQRQRALQSLPSGPAFAAQRLGALQRLAVERRLAGDPVGADQAIARALALARTASDREQLSRIAQIVGAPTLWNWRSYGTVEPRMIALLEELLAQATDPAERARLGGALAVELAYDADGARRAAISEAAVAAARETGDDAMLGRALNNFAIANWQPDRRDERAAALDEALSLASLPPETEAIALLHRAPLALRRGDLLAVESDLARADAVVQRIGMPELSAQAIAQRAGLALLADRGDAEELAAQAYAELSRLSLWGAEWVRWGFRTAVARSSGAAGTIADDLVTFASRPEWELLRPSAALVVAESGDVDRARALLERWGLTRLPALEHWCGDLLLAQLAACAALIGTPDPAACYAALAPWSGQLVVAGTTVACWGPVDDILAALARRLGDDDAAAVHAAASAALTARVADVLGRAPRW